MGGGYRPTPPPAPLLLTLVSEQWMYLGMQRNTHITGNNLIPYTSLLPTAYEGEGRDGYRDQIVTCDVGVSLHSKIYPLFMKYSNGTSTQCYAYIPVSKLVLFLQYPICPFFHLLVATLFIT